MAATLIAVLPVLVVVAGTGYLTVAIRGLRYWNTPAGPPFVATMVAHGTAGVVLGAIGTVATTGDSVGRLFLPLMLILALPWGIFAMVYTGWRQFVTPARVAGVTVLVTTVALTNLATGGGSVLSAPLRPIYTVLVLGGVVFAFGLCLVGVAIVVQVTYRSVLVSESQGAALLVGGVGPFFTAMLGQAVTATSGLPATYGVLTAGIGSGALAAGIALERYHSFDLTPAASTLGRSTVVAELEEAIVVVDDRERVVDLNASAARIFEVDLVEVAGDPVEAVLGETLETVRSRDVMELHTATGHREFAVSTSTIADEHDRPLGRAILLRDVTDSRTRQQRLVVLNRVLRHNLRNDMNVVDGYVELLEDRVDDAVAQDYLDEIAWKSQSLSNLGEQARDVERLMAEPRVTDDWEPLSAVVGRVVADLEDAYPEAEVRTTVDVDPEVRLNGAVVEQVLWQLGQNAVVHNDASSPVVEIRSARSHERECPLAITVDDDGPGVPDHEWSVVVEGNETALQHGSGLGLWLVKWGVTRLGGWIGRTESALGGSAVTVYLPESVDDEDDPPSGDVALTTASAEAIGPDPSALERSP